MDNTIKVNYRESDKLTFAEWEAIHKEIRREEKAEKSYYIKQKFIGFMVAAVGIITPFLLGGDATFSVLALPLGSFLMLTKQKVMDF